MKQFGLNKIIISVRSCAALIAALSLFFSLGYSLWDATAAYAHVHTNESGVLQVWLTPRDSLNGSAVVVTGEVQDYGIAKTSISTSSKGSRDQYLKLVLKDGSILLNIGLLEADEMHAIPSVYNQTTCSEVNKSSASVQILSGSGRYEDASGIINFVSRTAYFLGFTKSGKCRSSRAGVKAKVVVLSGTGDIAYQ
jgi:hypothetical protein